MASQLHLFTFWCLPFLLATFLHSIAINSTSSSVQPLCHDNESSALMEFKRSISIRKSASVDPSAYPKLASWNTSSSHDGCCSWDGVTCDEDTGRVISLDLSSSFLYGSINSSSTLFHLVHLHSLNLADNDFSDSHIPFSIGRLSRLKYLNLSFSEFSGQIPSSFANLTQLDSLFMQVNQLTGQIPPVLTNLTRLRNLDFSKNLLQGPIPESISQLLNLELFFVAYNNLSGTMKLDIFLSLKNLTLLRLGYNQLTLLTGNSSINDNATLIPKFVYLGLASCNLIEFPDFLSKQDDLQLLGLGFNRIQGLIPKWIGNMSTQTLLFMDLSHNNLTGFHQPPLVLPWVKLILLSLAFNMLQGSLPTPPLSTIYYNVSGNNLIGEISQVICNMSSLYALDLSYNYLSGNIPQCLGSSTDSLSILDLGNNNLRGSIPQIYKRGSKLKMIDLSQNQLDGMVPRSLVNCPFLEILNLGENQINDIFPFWLESLYELKVLILHFNRFHGAIRQPYSSFAFPKLRIIDLSHNGFTGEFPSNYFLTWRAMKLIDGNQSYLKASKESTKLVWLANYSYIVTVNYTYSITLTNKGVQTLFSKILNTFTVIDLSSNQFEGKISELVGNLKGIHVLNLSNNNLIGHIPSSLGNLSELEALDLSQNKLSGEIPQQLTQLTFLELFNVSHNHLTGPIPQGRQFNTFENNSYEGNLGLCGDPLSKKCGNLEASPPLPSKLKQDDDSWFAIDKSDWFVICMGYGGGLVVGLIIGHTLTTRHHEWFVSTFGRNQKIREGRMKKSGPRR
ncbi:receptor-like protein 7 [Cornus florida]|uniref:receptor-like protein 7 n=1 Tax=Cornus florida TaxID=4283 RepID=UPI00289A9EF5|nr:receptor-like protein 7 [Cornus florida]